MVVELMKLEEVAKRVFVVRDVAEALISVVLPVTSSVEDK